MNNFLRIAFAILMLQSGLLALGQMFYYEGGYFEKKGNKWYEYKPSEKAEAWNWFDEVDASDANYYIIDNGNCKISVPKSPVNDFYIMLKGQSQWKFKYKSVEAPDKWMPRDRSAFHRAYLNEGGVCILASYCLLLDYANSTNDLIPDFDSYDVMSEYMRYHNTLEPIAQITAAQLRSNHRECERTVTNALNGYCGERGWSGLIQVGNFHKWLSRRKPWASHVEIVERGLDRLGQLNNTRKVLPYAYSAITEKLKLNTDVCQAYDYAALLIYYVESAKSYHAIFLGCDKDGYFMRGPNFHDRFTDTKCDFDFTFDADAPVVEYMLMKIKRPEKSSSSPRWKESGRAVFSNLAASPVPVKSLRLAASNWKSGKPSVRASRMKLASKFDPSFTVEIRYNTNACIAIINGEGKWAGRATVDGFIEYDLAQICPDLQVVSCDPDFYQEKLYYQ